jgi:hypothetical protein
MGARKSSNMRLLVALTLSLLIAGERLQLWVSAAVLREQMSRLWQTSWL